MPINLLKHKSYHVYNSQNIERVRRDEAEARLKQEEEEQQRAKAKREERLEELRARRHQPGRKLEGSNKVEQAVVEQRNKNGETVKREVLDQSEEKDDEGYTETTNVYKGNINSLLTGTKNAHQHSSHTDQFDTFSTVLQETARSKSRKRGSNTAAHDGRVKSSLDPLAAMERAVSETKVFEDEAERAAVAKDRRESERRRHRHRDGHRDGHEHRSSGERSSDRKRASSASSSRHRHHHESLSRVSKDSRKEPRRGSSSRSSRSK